MDLETVLTKALTKSQGLPVEDQVQKVMMYLEVFADADIPAQHEVVSQTPAPPPKQKLIVMPDAPPPRAVITAVPTSVAYRSIEDIFNHLNQNAPPSLQIRVDGTDKPWDFRRKLERKDELGLVRLTYLAPGSPEGVTLQFSTDDAALDIDAALGEIMAAAQSKFSAIPKKLVPRAAPPPPSPLEAGFKTEGLGMHQNVEQDDSPEFQRAQAALHELNATYEGPKQSLWKELFRK